MKIVDVLGAIKNWSFPYSGPVLRQGLRRDSILAVMLTTVLGTVLILNAIQQLEQQSTLADLVNTAGRLRMLSQRTAYMAYRAADGDADAKRMLSELHDKVDAGLRHVETDGWSKGIFRDPGDVGVAALKSLKARWGEYRELTSSIVAAADSTRRLSQEQVRQLGNGGDALLQASDDMVNVVLARASKMGDRVRLLLPITLVLGLLMSIWTYLYIHWRILKPLALIGQMSDRLAQGDLSVRVTEYRADEFGRLIERMNHNADTIQSLSIAHAEAEQAIRDSELRSRTVWEVSTDAILMIDAEGTIHYTNPAVIDVFGYRTDEVRGQNIALLQPARLREAHKQGFAHYIKTGKRRLNWAGIEMAVLHKSGREVPVELSFAHVSLSGEDWFVGFFRDISARLAAEADLRLRDRAIQATSEGVMITDSRAPGHPIIYVNPALERITGYSADEVIGGSGRVFLGERPDLSEIKELVLLLRERREGTVLIRGRRKNRTLLWIELSVAPVRNAQGEVTHYVSIFMDVTERKRQEEALLRSVNYDSLTGLPNRTLLYDRLHQAIVATARHLRETGVLFIDLDHFKVVNDSLGHDIGDKLLVQVTERLKGCLRENDTLARWGGDEFIILLAEMEHSEDIVLIAQRVLDSLHAPFILDDQEVYCGASIGGSVFPRDGSNPDALLQHADIAMYRAKEQGRNIYRLYAQEMQESIDRRLSLEGQLRKAVDNGELLLHYQPQIELISGRVIGAEALLRWRHPELGMVSPALFIPLAEESNLIVSIGDWVLHTACAEVRRWREMGFADVGVAVNLSARQFMQPDLSARVMDVLACHGVRPEELEVEITESLVMGNPTKTIEVLRQLQEIGVRAALDDFGTGYSSLAYLKKFPVSRLKIDKSFVQDEAIVRAVIQLAFSYGLETVAEGVEDESTLNLLQRLGCDIVQGYFYSRPLPADDFVGFLRAREDRPLSIPVARWGAGPQGVSP
ncbi:hypothetical protein B9N43_16635 [Denitratisoma sp. DHT3]|uniref:EAL domain-containing protein n=1 Tax=Denitratisoma sp. DHT3 TaxID=1981880 RepID=UPI0011985499|nr:EAL domain-containing protein [Denitratisoma sp. DHT3]QDX82720.1 hypothetical protein B9N43_16635 [Denitratisoma sp. DHT3]